MEDDNILSFSAQQQYGLITRKSVPYSSVEQVEEKTGMLFWSWNGQDREVLLVLGQEPVCLKLLTKTVAGA